MFLEGGIYPSIIVKHIQPPSETNHPRGWNTDHSHQRKLKSYVIETNWYKQYNFMDPSCRIPAFVGASASENEQLLLLEDLHVVGFDQRKSSVNLNEIKKCISWLASFHARFIMQKPDTLWETGCYWHLATRPDEYEAMPSGQLKKYAVKIDQVLNNARYQTIVHGDAKLANFCFSENSVAAVDFQYVGGGVGVKDLAYFLGSCLTENECEAHEQELLDYYFHELLAKVKLSHIQLEALEKDWRQLYPVAWADFNRFLEGWMPGHHKLHRYSRSMEEKAIDYLNFH